MKQHRSARTKTGRPPGFDRDQAVCAAMNLFWKRGVDPVTSAELADAMGIQRSSFYNSFGGKDAVFQEALKQYAAITPDRRLDAIQDGQPVLPELVRFLGELCRVRAADPEGRGCLVCNTVAEIDDPENEGQQVVKTLVAARLKFMEALFKRAISQGELPAGSKPKALAHSFLAFLLGLNLLSKVVRDEKGLWSACRSYLVANGIL